MSDRIRVHLDGRLGVILLNAGTLNILGTEDVAELEGAMHQLRACPVIVVQATGERAFCAGMQVADHTPARAPAMLQAFETFAGAVRRHDGVLVAKVAAPAIGGGFELALLCDFVVCSERARFSLPEITLGALPPVACELLPRAVGERRAAELVFTGRTLDAQEARAWGVVTSVVPHERLDSAVLDMCSRLLALSEDALRCCKRALRSRAIGEATRIYIDELLPTRDAAEGIAAFLERRDPRWSWSLPAEEVAR